MNYFECCHHCVSPKRYPGCHGTCGEYKEARARWDADVAAQNKDRDIRHYAHNKHAETIDGIAKYIRKRPKNKYYR